MRGVGTLSSIKNCIIIDPLSKKEIVIFGKKAQDIFNLQIRHPMTILQGLAIAISSFEKKLACE
jgi:tubby-related protein 1